MGDKSQYEGKSKNELLTEAKRRGLSVQDESSEDEGRTALEADDEAQQQGQAGQGSSQQSGR